MSAGRTAARKDKIGRAGDIGGNSGLRGGAMAGGDRGAGIGMKPDGIALGQPLRIGAQVEIDHRAGLEPERADDFDQDRRMRRLVNRKVKALVEFDRAREIRHRRPALGPRGPTPSALSAPSRDTASRTGMMETPSTSAAAPNDSFSPGASRPEIRRSARFAYAR